jgi:hypothetical protein
MSNADEAGCGREVDLGASASISLRGVRRMSGRIDTSDCIWRELTTSAIEDFTLFRARSLRETDMPSLRYECDDRD